MIPLILGAGAATLPATAALAVEPEFRKATAPMLLAYVALTNALAAVPAAARAALPEWGLVVGVSHGELEVTKEFLCTLLTRGVARPFLFQNALHNATLGFLSMRFGLRGPGLTTSTHHFAGEDALSLATDLLAAGACAACLCVGVEAVDAAMMPAVQAVYGAGATPGSDAGAVVLATPAFATAHAVPAAWALDGVVCARRPAGQPAVPPLAGYHGANALTHLAAALAAGDAAALTLRKPDGACSRIAIARAAR